MGRGAVGSISSLGKTSEENSFASWKVLSSLAKEKTNWCDNDASGSQPLNSVMLTVLVTSC